MKVLLINTCGAEGSVALADTSLAEPTHLVTMPGRSASERLITDLRGALVEAGWKIAEVEAIAVVTGPGSFTGVRVGLSAAKGLGEAIGAPLVAVSRLELLAAVATEAASPRPHTVCALLDAGRGDVYCGQYRDLEPLGETLRSLEDALVVAGKADLVVLCEETVARAVAGRIAVTKVPEPNAADALGLALRDLRKGEIADSATLDANYLRRTDAEIFSSPSRSTAG